MEVRTIVYLLIAFLAGLLGLVYRLLRRGQKRKLKSIDIGWHEKPPEEK